MSLDVECAKLSDILATPNKIDTTVLFRKIFEVLNSGYPILNILQSEVKLNKGQIEQISIPSNPNSISAETFIPQALNLTKLISEGTSKLKLNKKILPILEFGPNPKYSGGFADLYLSSYKGKDVMIKVMKSSRLENDKKLAIRELRRCEELRYDHIAEYLGHFQQNNGALAIVTKFYPAGSLSDLIKSSHFFSTGQKLQICYKIAKGLEFIQLHGLCHFDIKPANILMDHSLNPKISDLGTCQKPKFSYKTSLAYTLNYAPPEQMNGKAVKKSDTWNFAMTVLSLFAGHSPFREFRNGNQGFKKNELINLIENGARPELSGMEEIEVEFKELMTRAWRLEPSERPSIKEFRLALFNECKKFLEDPESDVLVKVQCSQLQAANHL
jgi:serine/threonine protein kinase